MKKLLLAFSVAGIVLSMVSCSGTKQEDSGDLFSNQAFRDSVALITGRAIGQGENQQLVYEMSQWSDSARAEFNKKDYLRGLVAALKADTTNHSYLRGYFMGVQLLQQFMIPSNSSAQVDVDAFIKAFSQEFLRDSIPGEEVAASSQEFQALMMRIYEENQRRALEARKNSPEALANKNAGEKAIADAKAADKSIATTESGLAYKIENPGEGDKPAYNSTVQVIYTGRLVDGTVFDSSQGQPRPLNLQGVIPGFAEGLKLLGKGGKATLYIPGDIAYGLDGQPRAGIGPNATLIFDVEVVDFTTPNPGGVTE